MTKIKSYLLTLIFFTGLISCREDPPRAIIADEPEKDSVIIVPPLVVPPVPEWNTLMETFDVDAEKGIKYTVENSMGSTIIIPPGIFVDSMRNKLTGSIRISYREFHDAAAIFCAGIPMDYDAAGMIKRFETAGMFELRAEQNKTEVFVDSGKVITVSFGGRVKGGDYHCFFLDEKGTRNWHYIGDEGGAGNREKEKILRASNVLPLRVPLGPDYFSFNYMAALDVMMNNNVAQIEVHRNNPAMKTKIKDYGLNWSNIYNYQTINFEGRKFLASMLVWKNLSGVPFPDWVGSAESVITQKSGNVYTIEISDKKGNQHSSTIEAVMPIKSLFAFTAAEWKTKYNETMAKVKRDQERLKNMADVYRTMEINRFGIYNYDRLMKDDDHIVVDAQFKFDRAIDIMQNMEVCFVDGESRSLIRFPFEQWKNFVLVPGKRGRLFALLPDHYIAVCSAREYNRLDFKMLRGQENPSVTIELKTIGKINSLDDLRNVLQ